MLLLYFVFVFKKVKSIIIIIYYSTCNNAFSLSLSLSFSSKMARRAANELDEFEMEWNALADRILSNLASFDLI